MTDSYQPIEDPLKFARISPGEMRRALSNAQAVAHIPKRVSSGWDPRKPTGKPGAFRNVWDY